TAGRSLADSAGTRSSARSRNRSSGFSPRPARSVSDLTSAAANGASSRPSTSVRTESVRAGRSGGGVSAGGRARRSPRARAARAGGRRPALPPRPPRLGVERLALAGERGQLGQHGQGLLVGPPGAGDRPGVGGGGGELAGGAVEAVGRLGQQVRRPQFVLLAG